MSSRRNITSLNFHDEWLRCNIHQEEIFVAPEGLNIFLVIEYFNSYGNVLKIGNGNITLQDNIVEFRGGDFVDEIRILSDDNVMWLTFTLDEYNYYGQGFSGYVETVNTTLDGKNTIKS